MTTGLPVFRPSRDGKQQPMRTYYAPRSGLPLLTVYLNKGTHNEYLIYGFAQEDARARGQEAARLILPEISSSYRMNRRRPNSWTLPLNVN
jgi:hypothetical protein